MTMTTIAPMILNAAELCWATPPPSVETLVWLDAREPEWFHRVYAKGFTPISR
jgi:hypothetical protein